MQYFYDGQIRRYITQFMRLFNNFSVKTGKGRDGNQIAIQVPVMYGDMTRQVANIIRQNSENFLNSMPRMACYVTGLEYARDRMQDPTFVDKMHIRERKYDSNTETYGTTQGANYTVERLMPAPYNLTMNMDIMSSNTDQKLQLMEQISYLFNPALEIQTTKNYIDWTSLSYVELTSITFSQRTIPIGAETEIDVGQMSFTMPIWITAPAKIKTLGVIQKIIMSMYDEKGAITKDYLEKTNLLSRQYTTPGQYDILLLGNKVQLLFDGDTQQDTDDSSQNVYGVPRKIGEPTSWKKLLDQYGEFRAGVSQIEIQLDEVNDEADDSTVTRVVGTIALDQADDSIMLFTADQDTLPSNTLSAIDAVIDPRTFNPTSGLTDGVRYIITDNINQGQADRQDAADTDKRADDTTETADDVGYFSSAAWKGRETANKNDIVQYNAAEDEWDKVFDASTVSTTQYVTNTFTGIQYKWTGSEWVKSIDGLHRAGRWTLII
jgi:hypothetical protein